MSLCTQVSLWLGGMIAVMVYLLVIPCIIKTNGDFALRCDCCAQASAEARQSPVSVVRRPVTNIMVVSPMGETMEDHWLHRPRLEDRSESVLSRSEPGSPSRLDPPEVTRGQSVSVPASPRSSFILMAPGFYLINHLIKGCMSPKTIMSRRAIRRLSLP